MSQYLKDFPSKDDNQYDLLITLRGGDSCERHERTKYVLKVDPTQEEIVAAVTTDRGAPQDEAHLPRSGFCIADIAAYGSSDALRPCIPTPGEVRRMFGTDKIDHEPEYMKSCDPQEWNQTTILNPSDLQAMIDLWQGSLRLRENRLANNRRLVLEEISRQKAIVAGMSESGVSFFDIEDGTSSKRSEVQFKKIRSLEKIDEVDENRYYSRTRLLKEKLKLKEEKTVEVPMEVDTSTIKERHTETSISGCKDNVSQVKLLDKDKSNKEISIKSQDTVKSSRATEKLSEEVEMGKMSKGNQESAPKKRKRCCKELKNKRQRRESDERKWRTVLPSSPNSLSGPIWFGKIIDDSTNSQSDQIYTNSQQQISLQNLFTAGCLQPTSLHGDDQNGTMKNKTKCRQLRKVLLGHMTGARRRNWMSYKEKSNSKVSLKKMKKLKACLNKLIAKRLFKYKDEVPNQRKMIAIVKKIKSEMKETKKKKDKTCYKRSHIDRLLEANSGETFQKSYNLKINGNSSTNNKYISDEHYNMNSKSSLKDNMRKKDILNKSDKSFDFSSFELRKAEPKKKQEQSRGSNGSNRSVGNTKIIPNKNNERKKEEKVRKALKEVVNIVKKINVNHLVNMEAIYSTLKHEGKIDLEFLKCKISNILKNLYGTRKYKQMIKRVNKNEAKALQELSRFIIIVSFFHVASKIEDFNIDDLKSFIKRYLKKRILKAQNCSDELLLQLKSEKLKKGTRMSRKSGTQCSQGSGVSFKTRKAGKTPVRNILKRKTSLTPKRDESLAFNLDEAKLQPNLKNPSNTFLKVDEGYLRQGASVPLPELINLTDFSQFLNYTLQLVSALEPSFIKTVRRPGHSAAARGERLSTKSPSFQDMDMSLKYSEYNVKQPRPAYSYTVCSAARSSSGSGLSWTPSEASSQGSQVVPVKVCSLPFQNNCFIDN